MKVGCAGILVEDILCGPLDGLPEAGKLVAVESLPTKVGGCAANVAIGLVRQGLSAEVAGCVGADAAGDFLLGEFDRVGIGRERVVRSSISPTSRTVILLLRGEDRRYIHVFGANAEFSVESLSTDWLDTLEAFYAGGVLAMPAFDCSKLAEYFQNCRKRGVRTFLDVVIPAGISREALESFKPVLEFTDFFLPNEDEAAVLTGGGNVKECLDALLGLGVKTALITQGENGVSVARADGRWHCGIPPMACVDPSGAGDAFCSGLIVACLRGMDLPEMLSYACAIGASATRALGTTDGIFTPEEAAAFCAEHPARIQPI
jgi:sugar/nucleoside kinase (ribokinase family)